MNVILDLCVVPMGVGVSVSKYVVACKKAIEACGLTPHLHSYGTTIEGDWEAVMAAVKRCHEAVHEMGVPRISTSIRLGTRTDRVQTIKSKVESVDHFLEAQSC